jgi:hypothetical protein
VDGTSHDLGGQELSEIWSCDEEQYWRQMGLKIKN